MTRVSGAAREDCAGRLGAVEARHAVVDRPRRRAQPSPQTATASCAARDGADDLDLARAARTAARASRGRACCPRPARRGVRASAELRHYSAAEQERVVGLAAFVHLELELGMRRLRARRAARRAARGSSPVRSVRTSRGSASSASTTARATSSNVSPPATGSPSASPSQVPLRDRDAVQLDVARGDRDGAGADVCSGELHRGDVLGARGAGIEGDQRPRARPGA